MEAEAAARKVGAMPDSIAGVSNQALPGKDVTPPYQTYGSNALRRGG